MLIKTGESVQEPAWLYKVMVLLDDKLPPNRVLCVIQNRRFMLVETIASPGQPVEFEPVLLMPGDILDVTYANENQPHALLEVQTASQHQHVAHNQLSMPQQSFISLGGESGRAVTLKPNVALIERAAGPPPDDPPRVTRRVRVPKNE
jgi:hypothetical protein